MTLLATHGHTDPVWVAARLESTADLVSWIHSRGTRTTKILTLVLIVSFGERLQNHRIFLLGLLDQVEKILSRIVARGRAMILCSTTAVILMLVLLLGTYIVIILALLSSAIICGINHG